MNNITQRFSIKRILLLVKIALVDDWKPFFLTGLIIGCLVIFKDIKYGLFPPTTIFLAIMLFVGVVLISKIFADVHEQEKGIYFFTLPASIDEKYLVKFIATLFGYFGFAILVCFAATVLSSFINSLVSASVEFQIINPIKDDVGDKFLTYMFLHSVFFTGSLFIKNYSFLKTFGLLLAASLIYFIGSLTLGSSLVKTQTAQFSYQYNFSQNSAGDPQNYWDTTRIVIFVVIPILFYVLSYMRFRKIEIKG